MLINKYIIEWNGMKQAVSLLLLNTILQKQYIHFVKNNSDQQANYKARVGSTICLRYQKNSITSKSSTFMQTL